MLTEGDVRPKIMIAVWVEELHIFLMGLNLKGEHAFIKAHVPSTHKHVPRFSSFPVTLSNDIQLWIQPVPVPRTSHQCWDTDSFGSNTIGNNVFWLPRYINNTHAPRGNIFLLKSSQAKRCHHLWHGRGFGLDTSKMMLSS